MFEGKELSLTGSVSVWLMLERKELSLTRSVSMYVGLHVAGLSVFLPIIYLSACQSVCSSLCFIVNISTDI